MNTETKNRTPYVIRLELLKMAREILTEDYYGKREFIVMDWQERVATCRQTGAAPPPCPQFPPFPSETDIISKAKQLNQFVSNNQS